MIHTCGQLKTYLTRNGISAERFAKTVSLSNMTIRRLVARKPTDPLPEKYIRLINLHAEPSAGNVAVAKIAATLCRLQESGRSVTDRNSLLQKARAAIRSRTGASAELLETVISALEKGRVSGDVERICLGALQTLMAAPDADQDVERLAVAAALFTESGEARRA